MLFQYKTSPLVCSQSIDIDVDGDILKEVRFRGGCPGNLLGIGRLVKGRPVDEVIAELEGVRCGGKATSCPDQLAQALKSYKKRLK